jgi:hypothetical protein
MPRQFLRPVILLFFTAILASSMLLSGCGGASPTATPTKSATKVAKATATPEEATEPTAKVESEKTPAKTPVVKKTPAVKKATPTPEPVAPETTILSSTLCESVDADQKPVNPKTSFGPKDTVYAAAELKNFPKGAVATGNWYFGDQLVDTAGVTSDDNYDDIWVSFNLAPTEPFPTGEYRLEILLGDYLADTLLFTVEEQQTQMALPNGYQPYASKNLGFSIGYPAGWSTSEDDTSASFTAPDPTVGLFVYSQQASPNDTVGQLNAGFIDSAKGDYPDLTIAGNQDIDFAGETWLETDFYYTDEQGTQQAWVDVVAIRNGVAYFIVLTAPLDNFEQNRQDSFLPMLDTFVFTR